MSRASPLLAFLGLDERCSNPTRDIATALAKRFEYVSDLVQFGTNDKWPTREEILANIAEHGRLVDDCDGYAFAAAYALHDLGVGARIVIGKCETGAGHAVCEDEHGSVIDNRWPGRVLTWTELERVGYRSSAMNALNFEEKPGVWVAVRVGADGCRDYSVSAV